MEILSYLIGMIVFGVGIFLLYFTIPDKMNYVYRNTGKLWKIYFFFSLICIGFISILIVLTIFGDTILSNNFISYFKIAMSVGLFLFLSKRFLIIDEIIRKTNKLWVISIIFASISSLYFLIYVLLLQKLFLAKYGISEFYSLLPALSLILLGVILNNLKTSKEKNEERGRRWKVINRVRGMTEKFECQYCREISSAYDSNIGKKCPKCGSNNLVERH